MPPVRVRRALLSVSDKTGLVPLAKALSERGVEILSTGGTARALRAAGIEVKDVSEETGFPEMLDGRVKTLHPKIHGALLGLRDEASHRAQMEAHGIRAIDLVVVDLYPFEATVAREGVTFEEAVEQVDIGGPAMIRSAAKNHRSVGVVTNVSQYPDVLRDLAENDGALAEETKRRLARAAFARTASYDAAIETWLGTHDEDPLPLVAGAARRAALLRYGENPHQRGALFVDPRAPAGALAKAAFRNGKELSFNNYLDADAAWALVREFEEPACVVVKHNNPCGVAVADDPAEAYERAVACDPRSAFGGVVALNRALGVALAKRMADPERFLEVLVAPRVEAGAVEAFVAGPKWGRSLRVLETTTAAGSPHGFDVRTIDGGLLVQDRDRELVDPEGGRVATKRRPSAAQERDLLFALRVVKHVRSNAIVLAKDGRAIGVGAGQMSRVEAVEIAVSRARRWAEETGGSVEGSVLASDAFFPFNDGIERALDAGVVAVAQPGGSRNDADATALCERRGAALWLTGRRHFRH
jgi:phosphoribosylaminoimidazolecarboxamide formyltransferase/IMP cyclohydrolase